MQEVLTESKPENLEDEDKDDSWEDLTGEIEKEENCEAPKDSTTRNQQPVEGITALQRLPSFEVLAEYPLPTVKDFVKVRENVFTQQQTTFAFGNLTTDACPLVGFKRKVHKNTKWLANSSDKKPTIKIQKKQNVNRSTED
ncbi:uncharacterized protein CEXT_550181 [Caerostris extrusa]|uniref:Uncharacterized protein n=1 Tax=Caerostris extrusa TaxID=172846 RepID=A0AAV4XLX3_CAEEX|nr:uncharacterized protein CEXT_550181 [Caerostris extrusa]